MSDEQSDFRSATNSESPLAIACFRGTRGLSDPVQIAQRVHSIEISPADEFGLDWPILDLKAVLDDDYYDSAPDADLALL
jgi:hypothetical protein